MSAAAASASNHLLPSKHPILQTRTITAPITDIAPIHAVVETHRAAMLKMFSAMQPYVCADETRHGLNRVHVEVHDEKHMILIATDGSTAAALAVEFFEPHGIKEGCVGLTSASVKAFVVSKGYAPFAACPEGEDFPWLRNVVSLVPRPYAGVFGVNPNYFARMATAMKKLGYGTKSPVRVENGEDQFAPILATANEETVGDKTASVVVKPMFITMPMRLE